MRGLILVLSFFLFQSLFSYTAWDGKEVPPLPLTGTQVVCSTAVTFYMAMRTQSRNKTIIIKDGTYDISNYEPVNLDSPFVVVRGQSDDPTKVVLVGKGFENCVDVNEEMIKINTHDVTFANLTLSEVHANCFKFQTNNNDHTILHNVRFLNVGERMVKGPGTLDAAQCSIRYCHFEDTKIPSNPRCGASATNQDGNYIAGMDIMMADSWVVHDCVFRNIKGTTGGGRGAVFMWNGCRNMIVERNTFIGCDRSICYGNPSGTTDMTGGIIRNNFIVRGADIGIEMEHSSDVKIYNNTLYSANSTYSRTIYFSSNGSGNELRNNIIFGSVSGSVNTMSNNINKTASGDAAACVNWFTGIATANLRLTANATQAINAGAADLVTDDWEGHLRSSSGNQNDIGADEYQSVLIEQNRTGDDAVSELSMRAAPNPFNPSTELVISGDIGNAVKPVVRIYDPQGALVQTIATQSRRICWDASGMPSGVYVASVEAGSAIATIRLVLLK